jgi:hypothetical protein
MLRLNYFGHVWSNMEFGNLALKIGLVSISLTLLVGQWWNIVLQAMIQVAMQKSINILVSCDEVTTIDSQVVSQSMFM